MNLALLRNERCVRWLPLTMLIAAFYTVLLGKIAPLLPLGSYSQLLAPVLVCWAGLLRVLPLRCRVEEHERSLPIAYGELLVTRAVAVFLAWALPLATCTLAWIPFRHGEAVLTGLFTASADVHGEAVLTGHFTASANLLAAGLVWAGLCFRWHLRSPTLSIIEVVGLVAFGIAVVSVPVLVEVSWIGWVYAALGLYLFRGIRSAAGDAIPDPSLRSAARPRRRVGDDRDTRPRLAPLTLVLFRSTLLRRHALLALGFAPVLALMGRAGGNSPMMSYFTVFFAWQYTRLALNVLNGVDSLPLNRSRVLPFVALPPLAALLIAFGISSQIKEEQSSGDPVSRQVSLANYSSYLVGGYRKYRTHVRVPAHLWRVSAFRTPVEITAPWGESATMEHHSLLAGFPLAVYNPYDIAPESSLRFMYWQLGRALEDATGAADQQTELERRVLALYKDEDDLDVTAGVATLWFWPHMAGYLQAIQAVPTLPLPNEAWFLLAMAGGVWLCLMAFLLRPNIPPPTRVAWQCMMLWRMIGITVAVLPLWWLATSAAGDRVLASVLPAMLHHALDSMLGSSTVAWILADAALIGGSYVWLCRRINRIEVPPAPTVGWARKLHPVY